MGPWWMYALVFLFGYLTHKTFYFVRSVKISINLMRVSQLVGLAVLAKSMENLYYTHTARMRQMNEQNVDEKDIRAARRSFNVEISNYKEKAINEILELHPSAFAPIIEFDNWNTAMKYLENNREFMLNLLKSENND